MPLSREIDQSYEAALTAVREGSIFIAGFQNPVHGADQVPDWLLPYAVDSADYRGPIVHGSEKATIHNVATEVLALVSADAASLRQDEGATQAFQQGRFGIWVMVPRYTPASNTICGAASVLAPAGKSPVFESEDFSTEDGPATLADLVYSDEAVVHGALTALIERTKPTHEATIDEMIGLSQLVDARYAAGDTEVFAPAKRQRRPLFRRSH